MTTSTIFVAERYKTHPFSDSVWAYPSDIAPEPSILRWVYSEPVLRGYDK